VTTTEPNAGEERRGRHAKRNDEDRTADPADVERAPAHGADEDEPEPADDAPAEEEPAEEVPPQPRQEGPREERPEKRSSRHAIAHHPAGSCLLLSAGLLTGLALAPPVFDRLRFEVATRAADAARSAAAPWPAGGEPWFWPGSLAVLATVVAIVVLVIAAFGVRLPDLAVLAAALLLAVPAARAAWATLAVLDAHLWELVPLCIVCVAAFGSAVAAAFRWRSGQNPATGAGASEVVGVTLGAWLLVVLLFLGGSAIASSAQTHAFGNVTSPPQDVAGLLSVRAADAPQVRDLRRHWAAQVGAAQVHDDADASAYAVVHHDLTTKFPTLLARGDDVGEPGLHSSWWLSLAAQPFASSAEASAWCATSGVAGCTPRLITG